MKKLIALTLGLSLILTGCGQKAPEEPTVEDKTFKIGISQLVEHVALDSAKQGFIDELKALGVNATIDEKSAQAEPANAQLIAEKFVSDKVDMIFSIATMTTQAAKKATEGTDIPVIFTAVTDPVFAQIIMDANTIDANVTGVTDAVTEQNQKDIFQMILDLKLEVKKVGIIYNTGESNSDLQVKQATEIGKTMGIEIVPVGITSINDVTQAVNTVAKKADALMLITDNLVASAAGLVAKLSIDNQLITASVDFSHVQDGILIAKGVSYYELGRQAANIAKKILVDGANIKELPVETSDNLIKKANQKTLDALGLDAKNKAFEGAEIVQ